MIYSSWFLVCSRYKFLHFVPKFTRTDENDTNFSTLKLIRNYLFLSANLVYIDPKLASKNNSSGISSCLIKPLFCSFPSETRSTTAEILHAVVQLMARQSFPSKTIFR